MQVDERAVNLSLALLAQFDSMNQERKMQFAFDMMHCSCECCAVLKKIMSAQLAAEVFRFNA
jgi:hypothetical protein